MSKKHNAYAQIKLDPENRDKVIRLAESSPAKLPLSTIVNALVRSYDEALGIGNLFNAKITTGGK